MKTTSQNSVYQPAVMRLHWLSAGLTIFLLGIGFWMADLSLASEGRRWATRAHVVGGLVVILVTLVRLVYLIRSTAPPPLEMSWIHRLGVSAVHALQYLTLIGLLASGFGLVLSAELWSVFSGAVPLPDMSQLPTRFAHGVLAKAFTGLLVVHVGGGVLNQLQGGGTFQRMGLPRKPTE